MWGLLGVIGFSGSLPATRVAVPVFGATAVGTGRAVIAAVLAGLAILAVRAPRPTPRQWRRLVVVALGVVFGFPILTALALRTVESAHGAVVVGLLPIATAIAAVLRAGERPRRAFWLAGTAGALAVLGFAAAQGAGRPTAGDLLLVGAVIAAAVGYAEGGALAREMPGWHVIGWALLLSLPLTVPITAVALALDPPAHPDGGAWLGLAYVSAISMFLGFVAWYRGLAAGGVARVGQLQLAQPVLTLVWSALLLSEHIDAATALASVAVLAITVVTQRTRTVPVDAGLCGPDVAPPPLRPAQP